MMGKDDYSIANNAIKISSNLDRVEQFGDFESCGYVPCEWPPFDGVSTYRAHPRPVRDDGGRHVWCCGRGLP